VEIDSKNLERIKSIKADVTIEEVKSIFIDACLIPPAEKLYRMDSPSGRFYVLIDDKGNLRFKRSVTSIIKKYHRQSDFLVEWMAKDIDAAKKKFRDAGRYGTFIHILWKDIIIGQSADISNTGLALRMYQFAEQEHFDFAEIDIADWSKKAKRDVMGFIQWVQDYRVKPYVVEQTYSCSTHAGTIDLVGEITIGKNRILAMVDFKSGAEWDDHPIQLQGYVDLWKENNSDIPVAAMFNYYAKDYRLPLGAKVKPYKFVDQTGNQIRNRWYVYLKLNLDEEGEYRPEPEYRIKDMLVDGTTRFDNAIERYDVTTTFKEKSDEITNQSVKQRKTNTNPADRKNKSGKKKPVKHGKRNPRKR
jgi:hypothetical protein